MGCSVLPIYGRDSAPPLPPPASFAPPSEADRGNVGRGGGSRYPKVVTHQEDGAGELVPTLFWPRTLSNTAESLRRLCSALSA